MASTGSALSFLTTMARPATWSRSVGGHHRFRRDVERLVGHDGFQLVEPEGRHAGQHFALAGNRRRHHHVEGRQAVGGDDQQLVVADGVDVAHLAAVNQRQGGDAGFEERCGHGRQGGIGEPAL